MEAPELTNARVLLRQIRPDDAAAWLAGEDEVYLRAYETPPSTEETVEAFITAMGNAWREERDHRHWAVVDRASGEVAGSVDFRQLPEGVRVAYALFPPFRGRGLGTDAVRLALGFARTLGAEVAWFRILDWNAPSIRLASGLGASLVGTEPSHADGTFNLYRLEL